MKTKDLKGKTIWITGASSGIGSALAMQLNRTGAIVIASARRTVKLDRLKATCHNPSNLVPLVLDITDQRSIEKAVKKVNQMENLDLVIHNAGIAQKGLVIENAMEVDRKIMETNYFGTVALTKAVLPRFVEQGFGWFAVVSSFAGVIGVPGRSAYAASKHALHGFFDSLKAEHMSCKLDLSFIIPGFINTNITVKGLKGNGEAYGKLEKSHRLGMSADCCAAGIISGLNKRKRRITVGRVEVVLLYINRISPALSRYIVASNPMKKWRKFIAGLKNIRSFFTSQANTDKSYIPQGKVAPIVEKEIIKLPRKSA